jgi:hypothetical protein
MRQQIDGMLEPIKKAIRKVGDASPQAIMKAMQPIMDLSQEYVPYLSGDLHDSAFVETRMLAKGPLVVFGYAKYGVPNYAAIVHERTWVKHAGASSPRRGGRSGGGKAKRAKFLESAINERWHVFLRILEVEMMAPLEMGSAGKVR